MIQIDLKYIYPVNGLLWLLELHWGAAANGRLPLVDLSRVETNYSPFSLHFRVSFFLSNHGFPRARRRKLDFPPLFPVLQIGLASVARSQRKELLPLLM